MTTIVASRTVDSKGEPVIVLGSDLQVSYTDEVVGDKARYYIDRKRFTRKITGTPDKALIWAMTGALSRQYEVFCDEVSGKKTPLKSFNLVDELNKGRSFTIARLNAQAMLEKEHLDPNKRFNLAIVYRTPTDLRMWYVTETGKALRKQVIFAGSGKDDAIQAYRVLGQRASRQGESPMQSTAWLVFQSLSYATRNDSASSGIDIVVIRKGGPDAGVDDITSKPYELSQNVYIDSLSKAIESLEPAKPKPAEAAPSSATPASSPKNPASSPAQPAKS